MKCLRGFHLMKSALVYYGDLVEVLTQSGFGVDRPADRRQRGTGDCAQSEGVFLCDGVSRAVKLFERDWAATKEKPPDLIRVMADAEPPDIISGVSVAGKRRM